ncbi:MAG: hypothetical protein HY751_00835 [Nitrospinae bacterium]|nr:hypothetical protein [Nitrospinota bacterium]
MPKRELVDTALLLEKGSSLFPLDNEARFDAGWPLMASSREGKPKALIFAIKEDDALQKIGAMRKAGLRLAGIFPAVAALCALVARSGPLNREGAMLLALVDEGFAAITVFSNGALMMVREFSFPHGAQDTAAVIARETSRTLDTLKRTMGINQVSGFITGETAFPSIAESISETCGTQFAIYDPLADFVICKCSGPVHGPSLALSLGAALDGGKTVNLASGAAGRFYDRVRRMGNVAKAAVACFALVLVMAGGIWADMKRLEFLSARLEKDLTALRPVKSEYENNMADLNELELRDKMLSREMAALSHPAVRKADWNGMFGFMSARMPHNMALTKLRMDINGLTENKNAPIASQPVKAVKLEGLAKGPDGERISSVRYLVEALNDNPYFATATLARLKKEGAASGGMTEFEIVADWTAQNQPGIR